MKSIFKRCIALALVIAMSLSGAVNAFAASYDSIEIVPDFDNAIIAESNGNSELIKDVLGNSGKEFSGFKADSEVTFIVELEGESILEAKPASLSAAEYLDSFEGGEIIDEIVEIQKDLVNLIKFNGKFDLDVEGSYQVIMNGIAVSGLFGAKAYLENLPGVKAVYVSNTYDAPAPIETNTFAGVGSGEMIESDNVGYTGKGSVTAVIDTGLDVDHEAFANAPADPALTEADIAELLASNTFHAEADAAALYVSEKVPFAYNYNDGVADVTDVQQHGTHVSGTVGADCDAFRGVAPDTQIVSMKVFGDEGGASDYVIFEALEDAVLLGVDAINMSLGSPSGFTYEDELTNAIYSAVKEAGINLMVSAGNETNSVENTEGLGYAKTSEPDSGIVGSPSTYPAALSVASVNEGYNFMAYILSNGTKMLYSDTNEGTEKGFVETFNGQEVEYVVVPGLGAAEDFAEIDVTGKIALVQRGELAFTEKEANAAAAGAIGLIVYDNVEGALINMQTNSVIPSIFVSLADGEFLAAQETKTVSVSADYKEFAPVEDAGLMSSFSSLGPAPDLSIKPEITAPGGYVYSTLPGGTYGSMSGTSMAAPHMAGAAAIMQEYVKANFPTLDDVERQEFINALLMCTAEPVLDEYNTPYAVRKQGAGLAKVSNAVNTGAYVTVAGSERPKAELGDNMNGEYGFELTVHNFSDEELVYAMNSVSLTSYYAEAYGEYYMLEDQMVLTDEDITVEFSQDEVIVPAGGEVTVAVKIALTEGTKEFFDALYANGTFVEGFIILSSGNEDGISLTVPYLGFYGDWGQAPIFDDTIYDEEPASVYNGGAAAINLSSGQGFYLGYNLFYDDTAADPAKVAFSPEMVEYGYVALMDYGLLRAPKTMSFNITDENGEAVEILGFVPYGDQLYVDTFGTENTYENVLKSFYYSTGGYVMSAYGPTDYGWVPYKIVDNALAPLADGWYTINATAKVDGTNSPAGTKEHTMPIYIDGTAPEVIATRHDEVEGEHYVSFALYDSHYVMGMQLISPDGEYAFSDAVVFDDNVTEAGEILTFTYNVTGLVEAGFESLAVYAADYAQNESISYEIPLTEDLVPSESITLENQISFVYGEKTFEVEAYIEPSNILEDVIWTSSDEEIATVEANGTRVDENGKIYYKALVTTKEAVGTVTITASTADGLSSSTNINVFSFKAYLPYPDYPECPEYPELPEFPDKPVWPDRPEDDSDKEVIEKDEDEANPETGAPANGFSLLGAVAVVAACAVATKKFGK